MGILSLNYGVFDSRYPGYQTFNLLKLAKVLSALKLQAIDSRISLRDAALQYVPLMQLSLKGLKEPPNMSQEKNIARTTLDSE